MYLGLDFGTRSVKALVLDHCGQVRARSHASYPVRSPLPGWAETAPAAWWTALGQAVRQLGEWRTEVRAVGLCGQMHSVGLFDEGGRALRPAVLWADTRSTTSLDQYTALSPSQQARLGNPLVAGMTGPSLLWLRDHEPEHYAAARWALQPKDWIGWRLTGEVCADHTDASATLLYDLANDGWSTDIQQNLGLTAKHFAPLRAPGTPLGLLSAHVARRLQLPGGIPVAVGAGDTPSAMLGSGLAQAGPGVAQLTVGTGAQLIVSLNHYHPDPLRTVHTYRSCAPGGYYAMAALQNAGLALEWVRAQLGLSWVRAYSLAFAAEPGSQGLLFLPYLSGERTPLMNPDARGAWLGLGLGHTRAHLMRAAFEGVAFAIGNALEALVRAGHPIDRVQMAGGGSLDPRWRQLLADVLQRGLWSVNTDGASARGAAMLAAQGTGTPLMPVPEAPQTCTVPADPAPHEVLAAYRHFQAATVPLQRAQPAVGV
jgi:xylulokinase